VKIIIFNVANFETSVFYWLSNYKIISGFLIDACFDLANIALETLVKSVSEAGASTVQFFTLKRTGTAVSIMSQ